MALTLQQQRDLIEVSKHGRRLGIDHEDFLCGTKDSRVPVTAATTASTGTEIVNYGMTTVAGGASSQTWKLAAPTPGARKYLSATSTSTKGAVIKLTSGTFNSTGGTSATAITLHGVGQRVELVGASTSRWNVVGGSGFTST